MSPFLSLANLIKPRVTVNKYSKLCHRDNTWYAIVARKSRLKTPAIKSESIYRMHATGSEMKMHMCIFDCRAGTNAWVHGFSWQRAKRKFYFFWKYLTSDTFGPVIRAFKQIAKATITSAVAAADSWREYVTVARQISTLSKRHPNSVYGVLAHCFCC